MKKHILLLSLTCLLFQGIGVSCFEEDWDDDYTNPQENKDKERLPENKDKDEEPSKEKEEPKVIHLFTDEEMKYANTAADADYMSADEKKMILLCNLARLDGDRFAQEYLTPYLKGETNKNVQSLQEDLRKTRNLPMFTPLKELHQAAAFHLNEMIESQKFEHSSPNGDSPATRIKKYVKNVRATSENIGARSSAKDIALDFTIQLLIDSGVESLGHRKTILGLGDTRYDKIGVAIGEGPVNGLKYVCVQDFVLLSK
ncbi:MAG: hypothetical protein IKN77_10220 [Paludibacteraceae bacterium]|nr:hypothetical protein [Paludibacteraceae bacterium]